MTAEIPLETSPGSGINISDNFTFQITVSDSCPTTTLNFDPVVTNMITYVNLGAETQVVLAKDTSSTSYGNNDGQTLCGPRTYSISPTTHSFLSLAGDTITLVSTDPSEHTASPITITISVTLDSYPMVSAATQTFTIQVIDRCLSTSLNTPNVSDLLAYVSQGPTSHTVTTTDTIGDTYGGASAATFCGPRTYTITPSTYSFLTFA